MNKAERLHPQQKAKETARPVKALQSTGSSPNQQTLTIKKNLDLALQHHNAGRLSQAEGIYQQIVKDDPNHPVALHLLGVISHQAGKNEVAVELITKALAIKSDYAEAYNNLGAAFEKLERLVEAVASYHKALTIKPSYAMAHYNLGSAFHGLGRLEEAIASYQKALELKPNYTEAYNNLGNAFHGLGRLDEAVASYHKAIAIQSDYAEAHSNLGIALQELGKLDEAFMCHRHAVAFDPNNELFWAGMAESLAPLSFTAVDDNLLQDLWDLLEQPTVDPTPLLQPVISALRHHPDFSQILELMSSGKLEIGIAYGDVAEQLSAIPLFLQVMGLGPINSLEIERMLTFLRRAMIEETVAGKTDDKGLPFSAALALQCFANEYVFRETDEEEAAVELLKQQIAALVEKGRDVPPSFVVTLGAYRPLYSFSWAQELCEREWVSDIMEVVKLQISEPQKERSLRSRIPSPTSIRDTISQSVREQYEENPYPRWIKTGIGNNGRSIGDVLRGAPLRFDLGDYVSPESPKILVAGCGTGKHALATAAGFSNAHVLAVDLSLSSLSYALRKTKELSFSNIEYAQWDIMELGSLGRKFDLIECVGTLHHLGDPLAGWQVLVDLLHPGGLMIIGLYSEIARQDIIRGRSLIAEKGYTTSPKDIRRCRQDIIAMAEGGNREMKKICCRQDFFTISGCRDLLFHVQEHRFTLPQIGAALQALKLEFLGFEMRDRGLLLEFMKSHTSKCALTSLDLWHEFELENPDTFGAIYQFWCKKM